MEITALVLAILCTYARSTPISSTIVLDDLVSYLQPNTTFKDVIATSLKSSKNDYECDRDTKAPLSSGEYAVDTKSEGCGWEFGSISVSCNAVGVGGLGFALRNVLNESLLKNVNAQNKFMAKTIDVPSKAWVTQVALGFSQNFMSSYLVSLVFTLSNGNSLNFSCARPTSTTTINISAYERITGYYGFTNFGSLTSLNFYRNRVIRGDEDFKSLGTKPAVPYSEVVAKVQETETTSVRDKFVNTELVGQKMGKRFEDPYFYGHWKMAGITLAFKTPVLGQSGMNALTALQSTVNNGFFDYSMSTEIHGIKTTDSIGVTTISTPASADIAAVEIVTTLGKNIVGLRFLYTDGTKSEYIGESAYKIGVYANRVDVGAGMELMGFWGYASGTGIEGLGLMLVHKNDVKLFYEAN